jgi:hypothetical protein
MPIPQNATGDSIQAFMGTEPHLGTMARLDDWCDEATFAEWEQASEDLPDWQTSYRRLVDDGQAANLTHASDAHQTRAFPPARRDSIAARTTR